jgi:predicted nucleic acid-binding protein
MKARKLLQQFGGNVTGTLGILKRLVRERFLSIDEGDAVLADMIREGYFSPVKSLTELS